MNKAGQLTDQEKDYLKIHAGEKTASEWAVYFQVSLSVIKYFNKANDVKSKREVFHNNINLRPVYEGLMFNVQQRENWLV